MIVAIVPAHNEGAHIGSVVRNLFRHVTRVVVVDDGSADDTALEAKRAGAVVLRHTLNRGQGAAIETGQEYARRHGADLVFHFDGDGQFDADDIPGALDCFMATGADVLFGSRFLDRRSSMPRLKRLILLPAARVIDRMFSGVPLSDAHNGFRLLNRRALEAIRLTQDRMAHATEILALVRRHGLKFVEYPVKVSYVRFGQGARGGAKVLGDLLFGAFIKK